MKDSDPILDWYLNDRYPDAVSLINPIPVMITPNSPDPIWKQLNDNAPKGFQSAPPGQGWILLADDYLHYPGQPALEPIASAWLRSEKIIVYEHLILCIIQPDDSFTVGRIT